MATPDLMAAYTAVKARIEALPDLTPGNFFDGVVPKTLPKDTNGYVLPYVVMFGGVGTDVLTERGYTQQADTDVLDWPFQTTVAAADSVSCMRLGRDVYLTLTNLPVLGGFVKPDGYSLSGANVPQLDNQVTPARFYMPLQWRLTTT